MPQDQQINDGGRRSTHGAARTADADAERCRRETEAALKEELEQAHREAAAQSAVRRFRLARVALPELTASQLRWYIAIGYRSCSPFSSSAASTNAANRVAPELQQGKRRRVIRQSKLGVDNTPHPSKDAGYCPQRETGQNALPIASPTTRTNLLH